jgi:hypothetical protein
MPGIVPTAPDATSDFFSGLLDSALESRAPKLSTERR